MKNNLIKLILFAWLCGFLFSCSVNPFYKSPNIVIHKPQSGDSVNTPVEVVFEADGSELSGIKIILDGQDLMSYGPSKSVTDTFPMIPGHHILVAIAYDIQNHTESDTSVLFMVR
jgi:hypothetical protein